MRNEEEEIGRKEGREKELKISKARGEMLNALCISINHCLSCTTPISSSLWLCFFFDHLNRPETRFNKKMLLPRSFKSIRILLLLWPLFGIKNFLPLHLPCLAGRAHIVLSAAYWVTPFPASVCKCAVA